MALSLLRRSAKGRNESPSKADAGSRTTSSVEGPSASLDDFPLSWHVLLEVLPDGIAFVDGSGVIRYANDQLAAICGYARRELVGQTVDFLVPSLKKTEHVTLLNDHHRHPMRRKTTTDVELTLVRSDTSEMAVHLDRSPFTFAGETWQVVTVRDLYAQRAAELAHAEAELRFHMAFDGNAAR